MPAALVLGLGLALALAVGGQLRAAAQGHVPSRAHRPAQRAGLVKSPLPQETISDAAIQKVPHFDWRNVEGRSYVVADVQQHSPTYCGSCWVHGTIAALNDRIKILRDAAFPDVMLSRQAVMDCVPDPRNRTAPPPGCNGGDAWMIHDYMRDAAIPDETCQPYEARNRPGACSTANQCRNCAPPPDGAPDDAPGKCFAVPSWFGYGVTEHSHLPPRDVLAMKKEIAARGPIVCSMAAPDEFVFQYASNVAHHGGVFINVTSHSANEVDHDVEIIGWEEERDGAPSHWIGRNSWGVFWGEGGYFRIGPIGANTLFIEQDCAWAVPEFRQLDEALDGKFMGDYVRGILPVPRASRFDHRPRASERVAPPAGPAAAA